MTKKSNFSIKTKKILAGVGIVFGTLMTFLISFILTFCFIINPISFTKASDKDDIDEKVKTEQFNATAEKYKASDDGPSVYVSSPAVDNDEELSDTVDENDLDSTAEQNDVEHGGGTSTSPSEATSSSGKPPSVSVPEAGGGDDGQTNDNSAGSITIIDISE